MTEIFYSRLAPKLNSFLEFKRSLGYHYKTGAGYLRQFDAYCLAHGNPEELLKASVEGWIAQREQSSEAMDRSWMSPVREFGRYLRSIGEAQAYVLEAKYVMPRYYPQPYLLSEPEIEAFFAACDEQVLEKNHQGRHLVMPALFRFLHCCGVRCREARFLKRVDVHLNDGYVDIIQSKAFRDRRLFLSDELSQLLARYDSAVSTYFPDREYFFPSTTGRCYSSSSIGRNFNIFWDAAGLRRDGGKRPRAYDFRHHFAFANINRWAAEGKDASAMLPYLMRYMGHSTLDSTYYYIHLTPGSFPLYSSMAYPLESRIPEVEPYEV